MSDKSDQIRPKGRKRRLLARLMLALVVVLVVGGIYATTLVGTQLTAPEWVRARLVERLNTQQSDFNVEVGEVGFVMQEGWKPRILLRDLQVDDTAGTPLVNLSDIAGTVALRPLMQGRLQPASIQLSGARMTLRRAADGSIDFSLGDTGSTVDRAANIAALIDDLDKLLMRPNFRALKRISAENLTVQYTDLRAKRAWTVDGGRVQLTRDGDDLTIRGDFALLGGRATATTLAVSYSGRIGDTAAELGLSFQDMATDDIAGQSPALAWLGALDAPISGALRAGVDSAGALGPLNATLQIGEGALQPTEATDPIAFKSARSYFTYDPVTQVMQFDELSVESNWVSASASGRASLVGIENGLPREILGQMQVSRISANPNGTYPEPIELEGASLDVRLQIEPFLLSLGQLTLSDQGGTFVASGNLRAAPDGWDFALDGRLDALTPERLVALWPPGLAHGTRRWIDENVSKADLSDIQVALRLHPKTNLDYFLAFDFAGLTTRFVKKLPPIEDAKGHASLIDNRFVITADSGYVTPPQGGKIDVSGTSFIVTDVRPKRTPAQVRLRTSSTFTAALSLLDEEPFRFLTKADQPVTLADGRADLAGQLDLLLIKKLKTSDVSFDVTGTLSNLRSEKLVEGRILDAAELTVQANNDDLRIGGNGQISNVPFSGEWQTGLGPGGDDKSRFTGQIELSERFADAFRIGLPPGSISGAGQADITIELARDAPGRFSLSSNLAGVGLALRQLGWALPQSATGALIVAGQLGSPPRIETVSLEGGGLSAQGSVNLYESGALERASFSRVRMGRWLDAPVDLIGRGAGAAPAVRVRGGRIDMRHTTLTGSGEGNRRARGGPVSLVLDRLQISDGIALLDFRAELDTSRGADGNFTGKINGGAVINGRVVPQGGRSAFRIQSENAGAVMVSAGLLNNARDGKMDLVLTPAPEKGSYNGQLGIDDFRIRDIPSMAALLNAVSVIGILEQLQSDGLHFNRVDARFHLSPDRVTLIESSATGASLGISMDGYYYMASKRMDMQGVFSPIYLVNALGGIFTRRGEGLFGFTYTIKGPAASPQVSVNPLSALTPGMFREFFRREPPKIRRDPAPQGGTSSGNVTAPETREPAPQPSEAGRDR
ncbi:MULTISPECIES: AsmA-like C-terminal region-containing protein [unclassified Roseovarius]|uniref:AsmA-like C-terminal region-containing protein n=1 Tax=unclassified Roseovarius TaxID=2614913 RepID=UPI00273DD384|nr:MULTISPECIES: AsmA-like C-terminal region-containing protein [unclassified Roseovarius]